ncbi:MAG: hypothetical protein M1831_000524 [Alyxoria varia]|nr:MAG: hypothetical protein M1831_000524 [Alyxoria varia]
MHRRDPAKSFHLLGFVLLLRLTHITGVSAAPAPTDDLPLKRQPLSLLPNLSNPDAHVLITIPVNKDERRGVLHNPTPKGVETFCGNPLNPIPPSLPEISPDLYSSLASSGPDFEADDSRGDKSGAVPRKFKRADESIKRLPPDPLAEKMLWWKWYDIKKRNSTLNRPFTPSYALTPFTSSKLHPGEMESEFEPYKMYSTSLYHNFNDAHSERGRSFRFASSTLNGCTIVLIVSSQEIYMAHFWEAQGFNPLGWDEEPPFDNGAANAYRQHVARFFYWGGSDAPYMQLALRQVWSSFATAHETRAYIVTPTLNDRAEPVDQTRPRYQGVIARMSEAIEELVGVRPEVKLYKKALTQERTEGKYYDTEPREVLVFIDSKIAGDEGTNREPRGLVRAYFGREQVGPDVWFRPAA